MVNANSFNEFIEECCISIDYNNKSRLDKECLINYCKELGIQVKSKDLKTDLYNKLMEKTTPYKIYLKFRDCAFGIPSHMYEKKFELKKTQRKKMLACGFLKIRYKVDTKVFTNTYADVPYCDAKQFFELTQVDIDTWREKNIKGFKK